MPIGSESDRDIIRPKHHKAVPGLGVFIAPKRCRSSISTSRLYPLSELPKTARSDGENPLSHSTSKCLLFPTDVSPTSSAKI